MSSASEFRWAYETWLSLKFSSAGRQLAGQIVTSFITSAFGSNSSGGRSTVGSLGSPSPIQTKTMSLSSRTGYDFTDACPGTADSGPSDRTATHVPCSSYVQPWYGQDTVPS